MYVYDKYFGLERTHVISGHNLLARAHHQTPPNSKALGSLGKFWCQTI